MQMGSSPRLPRPHRSQGGTGACSRVASDRSSVVQEETSHSPQVMLTLVPLSLALLILLPGASSREAGMSNDEKIIRLLNLTTGYCKGASPPPDNGTANLVSVKVTVTRLTQVDMVKQQVSLESWIIMNWTDSRLAWNDSEDPELRNVGQIFVPMDWIWVPDLIVDEPIEIRNFERNRLQAILFSNGLVTIGLPYGITTKCDMQMKDFPFDSQQCTFSISSPVKTPNFLQLNEIQSYLGNDGYITNNEFCITDLDAKIEGTYKYYQKVSVTINFKRKPLYYVTVLIIPSALILITCIFGFLLPGDSGDRLALNVAILLSMSVFLQLAGTITPAQSDSVPALTWHFTVAMAVTALSTVGNIFVLFCHKRAAANLPVSNRLLRLMFLNRLCGWTGSGITLTPQRGQSIEVSQMTDNIPDSSSKSAPETVSMATSRIDDGVSGCGAEWRQIGSVTDRLLIISAVLSSSAIVIFLIVTALRNGSGMC